ncbi:anthocyanidin-3-O-glucoside rhamnosyltransferase-like [Populus alba x Populus x berolinensis]|nr:anthocyanidin-3-O-glucoside rhamnosyltransferase-like [Populus alba x Populus x berolinensis]
MSRNNLLKKALDLMQPQIKTILEELKPHFVFFDLLQHWLPKLASQIGIKTISYTVFSATSTSYLTVPAIISEEGESPSIGDLMKPPNGYPSTSITSVKAFQARDFSIVYKCFDGGPTIYDRAVGSRLGCTAMLLKSCQEMEGPYVDFIRTQFKKPVLLTGPLVPDPPSGVLDEKWANWLGQFPAKSVIFCSFGSETFLNHDQIKELVLGLELTERVKGRGVLHTGWVQQQLILAHSSVGCYVCHSGFSSLIEALVNYCQLAMLPLKGDQFLNTKLIAGDLKAGVEINRRDEDGYFGKDDICEAVKAVMLDVDEEPGKSTRENHKKWREFLLNAQIQNKYIAELIEELKAMV